MRRPGDKDAGRTEPEGLRRARLKRHFIPSLPGMKSPVYRVVKISGMWTPVEQMLVDGKYVEKDKKDV